MCTNKKRSFPDNRDTLYTIFGPTMANWTASIFYILLFHIVKKYPSSMHISNIRKIRDPNLKTVERLIRKEVYHFGSLR